MRRLIAVALLAIAVGGCQTENLNVEPIYVVQNHPVAASARVITADQVTQAIAQAAQASGWTLERLGPNQLKATQKWEDHAAIVSITNDAQVYSIRNDGSIKLREHDGLIHRQYNRRVHALEAAIDKQLAQKP